jgi:hypothetical protein
LDVAPERWFCLFSVLNEKNEGCRDHRGRLLERWSNISTQAKS